MAGTLTQDKIKNVFQKIIFYVGGKLYHTSSDNASDEIVTSIDNDISFGGTLTGASFDAKEDNITRSDSTSTTSSTTVATSTAVKSAYDRAWEPVKGDDDNYVTDAQKTNIAHLDGITGNVQEQIIVKSGTGAPTSVTSHTPAKGDLYIQYSDTAGDDAEDTAITGSENPAKIFIRDSDTRLMVIEPTNNSNAYLRMKEAIDAGAAPFLPTCVHIYFCNSIGANVEDYYQVNSSQSLHARCIYNSDVSSGLDDGPAQITFYKSGGTNENKDLDAGTNNTRTSSANTYFTSLTRDQFVQIDFNPNGAEENGTTVIDGAISKKIYARNDRIWGEFSGSITAGKIAHGATGNNNEVSSGTDYNNFGTKTFTLTEGYKVYFGIPNGTDDIESIKVVGNPLNQITGFTSTTETYTNASGEAETYKIWVSNVTQGAGSASFVVSGDED
ncbi:hypothetical protein N8529_00100 [bacterium]|nr:hypothetical protein [bacterium]